MWRDLTFTWRTLRRYRVYSLASILTLAIGIGASTAIFSVIDATLLRPLPYHEPDRLMRLASQFPSMDFFKFWISPPEFFELKDRARSFEAMGG